MFIQTFKGHSGCRVELHQDANGYFVRKISPSIDYNERLLAQARKTAQLAPFLPVAGSRHLGELEGLVVFDADYVAGNDFKAQCLASPLSWVLTLASHLVDILTTLSAQPVAGEVGGAFEEKIAELASKLSGGDPALWARISGPLQSLSRIDWSQAPATLCHGDLSLENLIFTADAHIVLIDVLDTPLSSYWLDASKIVFDLEIGWTLRDVIWRDALDARLLKMLSRYLHEEFVTALVRAYPAIAEYLAPLATLHALRIVPYTKDAETLERLLAYIEAHGAPRST